MARDFIPANNDKITTGFSSHAVLRTYSIWANIDGAGENGRGRIFEKRVAGVESELFYYNTTSVGNFKIEYDRVWNSSVQWTTPAPSTGSWIHLLVTYDSGSTSNDPLIYFDGVSQTITEAVGPPSGSLTNNADAYVLGARGNSTDRDFDGKLAEFAIWDRILTADEIVGLSKGFSPLFFQRSLVSYCPLIKSMVDLKNGAITNGGSDDYPHPRIIYPTPEEVAIISASAGNNYTQDCDEVITLVDSLYRQPGKGLTEAITIVDSIYRSSARLLTESIIIVDVLSKQGGKYFTEAIEVIDSISIKVTAKVLSETVVIVDTITRSFTRTLTEVVTIVDSIYRSSARLLIESITIVDNVYKQAGKAFAEVITVVDTVYRGAGKLLSEVVTLVEVFLTNVPGVKYLTEQISLTDSITILFNSLTGGIQSLLNNPIRDFFQKKIGGILEPLNKPNASTFEDGIGGSVTNSLNKPQGVSARNTDKPQSR